MQRDLNAFNAIFDVLVVGGGIYGACVARMAALSGWSVALLERDDFGGAVSHNSLKILHGGIRYIQHFDLPRIWESVAAQRAWLCAAAHLVRPLRCVVPAYGYGTRSPLAFAVGLCTFHVVAGRRNKDLGARSRLPRSGLMGRRALLSRYPVLDRRDLTGGAYWYDAQMLDANRLTFECIRDACNRGAAVANHVDVLQLRANQTRVDGVVARDRLSGQEFEVRARVTVNATGPFIERLLNTSQADLGFAQPLVWTRNVNVVTRKIFSTEDAVGVGSQRASDAAVGRSKRLFFVTPWQDCSVIGTSHMVHQGDPEDLSAAVRADVDGFLREVNDALPRLRLEKSDLRYVHSGLTPAEDEIQRSRRSLIIDHASVHGVRGLLTVLGIKYTTAPVVAGRVVREIARSLGESPASSPDFSNPLPGNVCPGMDNKRSPDKASECHDADWAERIYGANATELFRTVPRDNLSSAEHVFRCRVLFGIQNEMVFRLRDAVLRASDLAERGRLTAEQLAWCAERLAARYDWDALRRAAELRDVRACLGKFFPS